VAVPPDRDAEPVQSFRTLTTDLQRLADWLVACRVTTVPMESTGVYWNHTLRSARRSRSLSTHERRDRTEGGEGSGTTGGPAARCILREIAWRDLDNVRRIHGQVTEAEPGRANAPVRYVVQSLAFTAVWESGEVQLEKTN
jgi:hypothetical protein